MDYRMRIAVGAAAVAAAVAAAPAGGHSNGVSTWSGAFRLPQTASPVRVGVAPGRGLVVLGAGHAPEVRATVGLRGGRLRFSVPGRPSPLQFDGRVSRGRITGMVRQGGVRGGSAPARGPLPADGAIGAYRLAGGGTLGVFGADGPRVGVEYDSGAVHGLFGSGNALSVGSGILTRGTPVGSARFGDSSTWLGGAATRFPVRYVEVRFGALAATLWLPEG